jgi:hypothetical protein
MPFGAKLIWATVVRMPIELVPDRIHWYYDDDELLISEE